MWWDFPSSPVVKTLPSSAGGAVAIPGWGAKIPHASWPKNENIKTEVRSRQKASEPQDDFIE